MVRQEEAITSFANFAKLQRDRFIADTAAKAGGSGSPCHRRNVFASGKLGAHLFALRRRQNRLAAQLLAGRAGLPRIASVSSPDEGQRDRRPP
jgi:hypothetical protein